MKRTLIPVAGIILAALLSNTTMAQSKAPKDKSKLGDYDEIIIKRKGEGNGKVTVEIKDGDVIVNGKPLDDYEDSNISIRKRKALVIAAPPAPPSPYRSNGGGWSFNDNDLSLNFNENTGFLGVATEKNADGAAIAEVTDNSAAEKAGLKKGDIITKIDGESVSSPEDLTKIIGKRKPEDKVTITYKRDGKEEKATAALGKRPNVSAGNIRMFTNPEIDMPNFEMVNPRLNIHPRFNDDFFSTLSTRPRIGLRAQDTEDGKGVKVVGIDEESAAEKAGIKKDDIITEFDGKSVNNVDELATLARDAREKNAVQVKLTRNGKQQTLEIKTPRKLKTANL